MVEPNDRPLTAIAAEEARWLLEQQFPPLETQRALMQALKDAAKASRDRSVVLAVTTSSRVVLLGYTVGAGWWRED